jgi:hypothetical protein
MELILAPLSNAAVKSGVNLAIVTFCAVFLVQLRIAPPPARHLAPRTASASP